MSLRSTLLCLLVLLSALFLAFWTNNCRSTFYYEDTNSRSVRVREFAGPVPTGYRIIFTTPSYDPTKAVWSVGVREGFDEPAKPDGWLVVVNTSWTNIFRIESIGSNRLDFTLFDMAGTRVANGSAQEGQQLSTNAPGPRWSWKRAGEGYIYTDDFYHKPLNQMFSVALIRSVTNGITEVTNRLGTLKFGKLPYEPIGN